MEVFLRPELGGILVENVHKDGSLSDSFDGRLVSPGHAIEAMWFIMDLAVRLDRKDLIEKAVKTTLTMIKYGWDEKYDGISISWIEKATLHCNWNGIRNCGGCISKR